MNAISAKALRLRHRKLPSIANLAGRVGGFIAPRDHAGKGNWSKDADIPPIWAWSAGIALASFVLFGRQALEWLLSLAI